MNIYAMMMLNLIFLLDVKNANKISLVLRNKKLVRKIKNLNLTKQKPESKSK